MYIKRLEIVGFKSFPERALVPLSPGISAVVGPNGCGKSNIIDAIRWVMGEQSPRMLRGRNMDDVLFNGSQGRPASALAEVTLTLARDYDPESGSFSSAETSVTRRLYRSGDSEYLLNKIPCRLKDVVHFFMDVGVGTRAYGIIEQGRVGWLVDARPEERRGLIDEAAGITRYKQQKKEAERKIEAAEQNLMNVSVIKAETKKQLDQITRAAAKAARYRALKDELRELDLSLAARALTEGRRKKREMLILKDENRRLMLSLVAETERHELEIENIKLQVSQTEKLLEEVTGNWHRLNGEHDTLKKEATFTRSTLMQSSERRETVAAEIQRVSSEKKRKLEEESLLSEELISLEKENNEAQRRTEILREQWRALKSSVDNLGREHAQKSSRLAEGERELAKLAENMAGSESLLAHHQARQTALLDESARARGEVEEAARKHETLKGKRSDLRERFEAALDELEMRREAERSAKSASVNAAALVSAAESKLAALSAKLETLKSVKDDFGWYPQGVKALMASEELKQSGLIGPLAEHLNIPDGYEDAVEAVLGERLAWLLVNDRAAALKALIFLKDNKLGRCGFINREALEAQGEELTKALLGDFKLVDNIISAVEITSSNSVLSRDGEYCGFGIVAGGRASEGTENAGLLARLKEVELLTAKHDEASQKFEVLQKDLQLSQSLLSEATEAVMAAESMRRNIEVESIEIDKAIVAVSAAEAQLVFSLNAIEKEKEKTGQTVADLSTSLQTGRQRREELSFTIAGLRDEVTQLAERLDEENQSLEELRATGEESRMAAVSAAERLDRGRSDLERVSQWLMEVEDNLATREAELDRLAGDIERFGETLAQLEDKMAKFPFILEEAEKKVNSARTKLEEERRRQSFRENEAREARRRREELHSILSSQEGELLSVGFNIEKIEEDLMRDWLVLMPDTEQIIEPQDLEKSWENTQEDAPDALSENNLESGLTEEKTENQESINGPQIEILDCALWAAHELPGGAVKRRDELRAKISSLGEVSLGAIEKEAELRGEYERYQSQYDDLTKAISDLKDSINRINHTCRIRFAETFKAVDGKFREIFPILFEGGEGWISLTDDNDPLESGVEIHVHPPGKKVLVMSLLSGGEKALTALALIFALYLIKPSPFCLLDETDAPLDEANIDRFNRLLKQLSHTSQIIMVTHNKRTMQISHTLYGVTMETPGVSRLVSVNLAEAEAMTADV